MTAILHAVSPYAAIAVLMWMAICLCLIVILLWRAYVKPILDLPPHIAPDLRRGVFVRQEGPYRVFACPRCKRETRYKVKKDRRNV